LIFFDLFIDLPIIIYDHLLPFVYNYFNYHLYHQEELLSLLDVPSRSRMATVSRRFNKVALSRAAWCRVRAIRVTRVNHMSGSLGITNADGQSHVAEFTDLRELVSV
jgi:hypothetical protein